MKEVVNNPDGLKANSMDNVNRMYNDYMKTGGGK